MKILALLLLMAPGAGWAMKASELLKKVDEYRFPGGDLSFQVEVSDYEDKTQDKQTRYKVYTMGTRFARIETEFPERLKGRKLLMRGHDLWLYLPSIKRPTRVSFQQRLTGEVANGDLARISFSEDYVAALASPITAKSIHLKLTAKHKTTTYRKVELWLQPKTLRPVKAHYFALSGKLLKVSEFSQPKTYLGKPLLTRTVIRDALNPKRFSVLEYSHFRKEKLDAAFFTKESLP